MQAESLVAGLNREQRRAVEMTEGPVLVLAGAGSGKTRVLTQRIAYLVGVCGIAPEGILAVTFTNKAAGEMRERVEKVVGPEARTIWLSTFHSLCVRLLRREIMHLGFSRGFVIYDEGDALAAAKEAMRRHHVDPKMQDPKRLRWRIDQWKNHGISPAQAENEPVDYEMRRAAELYATYQRVLADAGALDFGDLIMKTVELFDRFPEVLAHYRRRFQYVLVDEYQDTNHVQYRLVQQIAGEHRNLCVVGDPDQSIYAWRGADVRNILDFERDYPDAHVVKLEQNYRSTQPILEGASGVVANNYDRREKNLFTDKEGGDLIRIYEADDDREESQYVVSQIMNAYREGRRYGECAIFYRTNAQSRVFEEEFLKYDVPYVVVGGVRFYDRAEVKDTLAYLRLVQNPADGAALRRIVNKPTRGIGKTTMDRAEALAVDQNLTLLEGLRAYAETDAGSRAAPKIGRFFQLMEELKNEIAGASPAPAISRVLDKSGYVAALEREGGPEAESRLENLRELLSAAEDFSRVNADVLDDDERSELELFLDQVALVSDLDSYDKPEDAVSLMTVHSAKGLEYPVVYLVGLEEGVFPHSGALRDENGIEEERRLCYVGMTRAMEKLTITSAAERLRFGQRTYGQPSRFLREIPEEVTETLTPRRSFGSASGVRSGVAKGESNYDYSYTQESPDDAGDGVVQVGLRVRHANFGSGEVIGVEGSGPSTKLTVRFARAGVKKLVLKYANLELS